MYPCFCKYVLVTVTALLFGIPLSTFAQTWQTVSSNPGYINRDEHGYVALNGKSYLIGGSYMGRPKVQVYDPNSNSWTDKGAVPVDFHHFQPVAYNNLIWIVCSWYGNYGSEGNVPNVWSYNPTSDTWTQRMSIPSNRRRGSAGVIVYNNKLYIVGGNSGGHGPQGDVKNWVDVYDPNANGGAGQWTALANMPIGRDHFQAVAANGKIYAIGGRDSGVSGNFFATSRAEVDIYDIATNAWTRLPSTANLPTLRAGSCNILMDDEILVLLGVGNFREDEKREAEAFNIQTHTWRTLPQAPHARSGTQAVAFGRDILIASGIGSVYGGTVLSEQDKLTIPAQTNGPPTVSGPDNDVVVAGQVATFTVAATPSANAQYQWQRLGAQGWAAIPGAQQATYTLTGITLADDSSWFRCEVSNTYGTVMSSQAMLSVRCGDVYLGDVDPIVMEAENYKDNLSGTTQTWSVASTSNAVGSALEAVPNQGTNLNTGYQGTSPELQYDISFTQTGTYYLWLRMYSPSYEDNSVHAGLDGNPLTTSDRITYDTYQQWGWSNSTMDGVRASIAVNSTGIHSLNIWMREDGVIIDRILLTRDANLIPSGTGPNESSSCFTPSVFPVELEYFDAKPVEAGVQISWATTQERNNAYFVVQKSVDQAAWEPIYRVKGQQFSDQPIPYSTFDAQPWQGVNYYRLKQVDLDGHYSLSPIIELSFSTYPTRIFSLSPNPVYGKKLTVSYGNPGEAVNFSILNLQGKLVKKIAIQSGYIGKEMVAIDLSSFQRGIYFLQFTFGQYIEVKKVVIP